MTPAAPLNPVSRPLVSIVTPVYNGARFIADCIRSVQEQRYGNWQYVIVDNCSTDGTDTIVRGFCREDSRIRLVSCAEFLPVIANHNRAIAQIGPKAKYCKPLMADDWLPPDCLESLVDAAERHPDVGLVCCYAFDGCNVLWDGFPFAGSRDDLVSVADGREVGRTSLLGGAYVFGTPSSCLIRADLVRSRTSFYDERNLHADHASCYDVLTESDFAFVHQVLVFNRVHVDSQTSGAERHDAMVLGTLSVLARFGPIFLGEEEFRARRVQRMNAYYRLLGRNALRLRGKSFWQLHGRRMAEIGMPISYSKLVCSTAIEGIRHLSHPVSALLSAWRWWVRRSQR